MRSNISGELAGLIRDMIVDGRIEAGARINEVHMAAELGVSRTPLREALWSLTNEGALDSMPRRGFFVRPLSVSEVEDIYPIRAFLDPEAMRIAGLPSKKKLATIERRIEIFAAAKNTPAVIDADDDWHRALWSDCGNQVLIDLIESFMRRTRRYELFLMASPPTIEKSVKAKRKVVRALQDGDLHAACAHVRDRLLNSHGPIIRWLNERAEENEKR